MPTSSRSDSSGRSVFVARQAIFDRQRMVVGYELLYRRSDNSAGVSEAAGEATARAMCDAVLAMGLEALVENKKAFINVDQQFVLDGMPAMGDPSRVVIELGCDVKPEPEVLEACRRIKAQGYGIALDDFGGGEGDGALLKLADYVKVDVQTADGTRTPALSTRNLGRTAAIATRVESGEAFTRAGEEGYRFFQGFFFGRPVVKEGRVIPPQQVCRLKLLKALQDPDLTTQQLEDLVKPDPALCYRILRTVNSAGFGLAKPPSSIKEALLLLGREAVLRWASLWVLSSSTAPGQKELLALSIVRARCSEVLAASGRDSSVAAEAFLMGLCSLLDVILERPMAEVLENLNLPPAMTAALLGEHNQQRELLDCVMAYASGDWTQSTTIAKKLALDPTTLPSAYAESLRWVRELQAA